jgi:hypothetical protein
MEDLSPETAISDGDIVAISPPPGSAPAKPTPAAPAEAAKGGKGVCDATAGAAVGEGSGVAPPKPLSSRSSPGFVPFPELAYKEGDKGGRVRKPRSLADIELYKVRSAPARFLRFPRFALLVCGVVGWGIRRGDRILVSLRSQITRQPEPVASKLLVDSSAMDAFASRLEAGQSVCALLFGRYDNGTRQVVAEALYQPDSPEPGAPYSVAALLGPDAARARKVAGYLGMVPVGWVLSHAPRQANLVGRDVLGAARLQAEAMEREGREAGSGFVTLTVNVSSTGVFVEAYQVSKQAVQMVADGLLREADQGAGGEGGVMIASRSVGGPILRCDRLAACKRCIGVVPTLGISPSNAWS